MNHEFYRLKPLLANLQANWLVGGREGGREGEIEVDPITK